MAALDRLVKVVEHENELENKRWRKLDPYLANLDEVFAAAQSDSKPSGMYSAMSASRRRSERKRAFMHAVLEYIEAHGSLPETQFVCNGTHYDFTCKAQ